MTPPEHSSEPSDYSKYSEIPLDVVGGQDRGCGRAIIGVGQASARPTHYYVLPKQDSANGVAQFQHHTQLNADSLPKKFTH